MNEINISRSILNKRKEKGLTQDALADYIGVSKASVSKWETGQSYPDITFLPRLAAFFNVSIDELMGYEPQMTKQDIRKLYQQLSMEFSTRPFDEVMNHCRDVAKKYFSCFPLLFQIGALYVNHSMLAGGTDETSKILEEAKVLFVRVKTESDDVELARQALNMEALCLLSLGQPNEVLELLEETNTALASSETLLASAYQLTGNIGEAKSVLQVGVYQNVLNLIHQLTSYLGLCKDDAAAFEETVQRTLAVAQAFQIKTLHPTVLMSFYITAAQDYMTIGSKDKALELLGKYAELVAGDIYPLQLHGDDYFNRLDDWLENKLDLGTALPRDEKIVRQSMTDAVASNPAFTALADEPRFNNIVHGLKKGGGLI
ncbi:helix-turn-helix domain-containing protein [Paenibacillus sp. NPDC058071]|uniref:helix-turn-helix domain-containing protein n=1 Tax=Paenibacillus sp. NPDC058071 TaxID=3346326 RepID=UPI0036D9D3A7